MRIRYFIILLLVFGSCSKYDNNENDCTFQTYVGTFNRLMVPYTQNENEIFVNSSNNYNIRCVSLNDTLNVYNQGSWDECEDQIQYYHDFVANFTSNIPIDPLNYIKSIRLYLSGDQFAMYINTSNHMTADYSFTVKYNNGQLDNPYNPNGNIKTYFLNTLSINNKTYQNVNVIYNSSKSFVDTIYYNNQVGFMKFVIDGNPYILSK